MRDKTNEDFGKYHWLVMEAVKSTYKHLRPEAVICFGCVEAMERRAVCNILVLAGGYEEESLSDVVMLFQRFFVNQNNYSIRVNWLLHSVASVKRLILSRHPFYNNIAQNGILLNSNCTRDPLPKPRAKWASTKRDKHWDACLKCGQQFLIMAELALSSELYKMTAYNLYLAVEWYGKAILQRYMGYKQNKSNIHRLFELLHMISPEFWKRITSNGDEEPWLLESLRNGYDQIANTGDSDDADVNRSSICELNRRVRQICFSSWRLEETTASDDMV